MVWRSLGCALAFVLASPCVAPGQDVINLESFEQTGQVVSVGAGGIVFDVLGQKLAAQIDSKEVNMQTLFELKGKAHPSYLKTGMFVRFPAKLDAKQRRIVAPIEKLTIFSPTAETRLGAFGDEVEVIAPAGPDAPARDGIAGGGGGDWFVIGRIARARNNELVVQLPASKLEGKLADNAEIDVSVTDKAIAVSMLRQGDEVHVTGGFRAEAKMKIYANRVVATLAHPLGEEPSAKRRPRRPADDAKVASPDGDAISPDEDFGAAAAAAAAEAAAAEAPADVKPARARILKVN